MYKKQMVFQRIVCFAALVAAALVFIYSLGMLTDLYDSLYQTIRKVEDLEKTAVQGSRIYYDMQPFDAQLTKVSIGLILVALFLFVMNTHSRRKYYIGNYVAVALAVVCNVAAAIWGMIWIGGYKTIYLRMDFAALKEFAESRKTLLMDETTTFWFDAGFVVFGFLLLVAVLLVANVILKIKVMKEEQRLIGSGKGGKA